MKKYDILIAGGGISGVSAAVSAARQGKKVLLVERSGALGGLATNGLVTVMMSSLSWFYGFGRELIEGLIGEGAGWHIPDPAVKGFDYWPFEPEAMKLHLERLALDSGVEILFYTTVTDVKKEGAVIRSANLYFGGENLEVAADVFIDTTGGAYLCRLAGEEIMCGDENGDVQAPTMVSCYAGVDFDRYEAFLKTYEDGLKPAKINMIHDLVPKAVEDGVLWGADLHHPGIFRHTPDCDAGCMNAGHVYGADVFTPEGMTAATLEGRQQAYALLQFYRKYVPGFENARMPASGELSLRECGRVVGEYIIDFDDKTNYRKFDDCIMRFDGGAVSDVHASSASPEAYKAYVQLYSKRESVKRDDWAELPYRCLQPKKTDNLLVAGRCVSADRKTLGQIRLQGYCAMMGQAAGLAAALASDADGNVKKVDIRALQALLKESGVETV